MARFGDEVSALVETYTQCLALLKAFRGHRTSNGSAGEEAATASHSWLKASIVSDRSQVCRAYSAKLSKKGRPLEKGDAESKWAIRHILGRMQAAMLGLLHISGSQRLTPDYESLVSLSNSSRVGAIKTMDRLSRRISNSRNSSSNFSRKTQRPKKSSAASGSKDRHGRSRPSPRRKEARPVRDRDGRNKGGGGSSSSNEKPKGRRRVHQLDAESKEHAKRKKKKTLPNNTKGAQGGSALYHDGGGACAPPGETKAAKAAAAAADHRQQLNRVSLASMSSDSTKLGEILPRRRARLVGGGVAATTSWDHRDCFQPVYPLHPYTAPERERRGLLQRLFGNRTKK